MPTVKFNAIRKAIDSEKEAYELYTAMVDEVEEENSKNFCREMAREELRHMKMLQELGAQELKELIDVCERTGGFKLDVVVHLGRPIASYELNELFAFAIKKEAESIIRYSKLAEIASDGSLKSFFENLAEMERRHASMVGAEYEHYKQLKKNLFSS